ncbi:MAG: hypothetical protein KatS3mg108_0853 [Isosphaeraceae bacterium]|jgi:hypothetical protein|nr:MAG: hypothetical protein KatS3mg108_0853 [Isosphaeraceae bacterium]
MPLTLIGHALLDNPITVKHVRSRLRRGQILTPVTVVAVLSLLIAWWGYVAVRYPDGGVARIALILQGIVLVVLGGSQVGVSLSGARESGILDFHRISPLPPAVTTLGFFFGAPVREYLLALIPIPLLLLSVAAGGISLADFYQWELALLLIAWVFHVIALLSALVSRRPVRNGGAGLILLGIIVFGNIFGWLFFRSPNVANPDGPITLPFFGLNLPWLSWFALYTLPLIGFGLLAATRKMQSARAPMLSKPQAVGFLGVVTSLILGALGRGIFPRDPLFALLLYGLGGAGIVASLPIVADLGQYTRGLRRAARIGQSRVPIWDDLALNRPVLFVLCGIVLLGGSYLFWIQDESLRPPYFSQAVAVTVLTVAYTGLAHQYLALTTPARTRALLSLFLFLVWVVPLLAGIILRIANVEGSWTDLFTGLSPISGIIAIGAGRPGTTQASDTLRLAALAPAVSLPLLFNNLISNRRRQIEAALGTEDRQTPKPLDRSGSAPGF